MKIEDVVIIGAGPAGLAAAIQLKRYGLDARIFERGEVGGLLRNANLVENYPGFPRGISGPGLVKLFTRQAQQMGVMLIHEEVTQVDHGQELFEVKTRERNYPSRVVILATGTKSLHIAEISIPDELQGSVFYEVYDLLEVEGKSVVIIGGGDAAFDYSLNLAKKNRVFILNRAEKQKCLPLLWERARKVDNITYKNNTVVQKVTKDNNSGMFVDCQSEEGELQFHVDYLLAAIGREANLECLTESFLQQAAGLEEQGVLYRIGDVRNGIFRQTSIAVGDGVMAAMKIYRYLKENS